MCEPFGLSEMFGRRTVLFRILGIEICIDASWIAIAVLILWSLASAVFPSALPGKPTSTYWWMALAGAALFFASILLHELSHALVARSHEIPIRRITLFIFGGVAEMTGEPPEAKAEFLMAIAGPGVSIALGFVFYALRIAAQADYQAMARVMNWLASINWILAGFNLVPAFPLDGGRVLRAALWHRSGNLARATEIASRLGSGLGFAIIAFAIYQLLAGDLLAAVWYFMIGMFVRLASRASYEQTLLRLTLSGEPVRRFMRPDPVVVHPDTTVSQFVEQFLYRYDFKTYPVVTDSGELLGCVSLTDVKGLASDAWPNHLVAEVMKPCPELNTVGPDTDAMNALSRIRETGARRLFVTDHNHLLAVVSPRDFLNFLSARMALSARPG